MPFLKTKLTIIQSLGTCLLAQKYIGIHGPVNSSLSIIKDKMGDGIEVSDEGNEVQM